MSNGLQQKNIFDNIEIRSRQNVRDYGEVFTPIPIVDKMLDLIPETSWKDPEFIFLEPTCGNGNILVRMFERRLQYGLSIEQAFNTMIGLDIREENIEDCHRRLYDLAGAEMKAKRHSPAWDEDCKRLVAIAENNIFRVEDSLVYLKAGKLKEHHFVFDDPTGVGHVLSEVDRTRLLKSVDRRFSKLMRYF